MKIEIPDELIEHYRSKPERFLYDGENISLHIANLVLLDLFQPRRYVHPDVDPLTGCGSFNKLQDDVYDLVWKSIYFKHKLINRYLCLDIENLRFYRDMHGLRAGDQVLVKVANQLRVRYEDANIYRYRGDEFVAQLGDKPFIPFEPIPDVTIKHSLVEIEFEVSREQYHRASKLILFYLHKGIIEASVEGGINEAKFSNNS